MNIGFRLPVYPVSPVWHICGGDMPQLCCGLQWRRSFRPLAVMMRSSRCRKRTDIQPLFT